VGGNRPAASGNSVAVRLSRLQSLSLDEDALLCRAGAGHTLGDLEDTLNRHGYTLGHVPQSLHLATVGGSVATNAAGLLSGKYGRQADLTLALEVVLPTGEIVRTSPAPGASAGPDLVRLFVGCEGTLGIVTEATLKLSPLPEARAWAAFTFTSFAAGLDALRLIHRTDARPACVRLFDADGAKDLLARHSLAAGSALLLFAFEGNELAQTGPYQLAHAVCQKSGGTEQPPDVGETFWDERFQTGWLAPNARAGGLADVFALSATWKQALPVHDAVRAALSPFVTSLQIHAGHADAHGAALDFVFQARAEPATPDAATDLYEHIRNAAAAACRAAGGAFVHHYGVGVARPDAVADQNGPVGRLVLARIKAVLDPNNVLNPGKLIESEP
jgi:alkyldihydroxyacetonephosphate synthase